MDRTGHANKIHNGVISRTAAGLGVESTCEDGYVSDMFLKKKIVASVFFSCSTASALKHSRHTANVHTRDITAVPLVDVAMSSMHPPPCH